MLGSRVVRQQASRKTSAPLDVMVAMSEACLESWMIGRGYLPRRGFREGDHKEKVLEWRSLNSHSRPSALK